MDRRSSSSWGCELKCQERCFEVSDACHPLREDVSWNDELGASLNDNLGHPLREDVSWNNHVPKHSPAHDSHPLREDVSWNDAGVDKPSITIVILFVRMWVEMTWMVSSTWSEQVILFVRMWVEILKIMSYTFLEIVILFVRMWVEIPVFGSISHPFVSSSSWGCELKFCCQVNSWLHFRHPLREDVSWNISIHTSIARGQGHPLREDVSWNIDVGILC